jgi:hypothetical protein
MKTLEEGVAFGAVGLAVVETIKLYIDAAPSLERVRKTDPGDYEIRQLLLDADLFGLVAVLAIGGSGAVLVRSYYPFLLAGTALLLLSTYYRSVARSNNYGFAERYDD